MTKGQALYQATALSLGFDPAKHGTQTEILAHCDDITTQPALSFYKNGKKSPNDETVAEFEERFGFRLVPPSTDWGFVLGGEE